MWAVLRAPEVNNFKEYFVVVGCDKMISLGSRGRKREELGRGTCSFCKLFLNRWSVLIRSSV